MKLFQVRSKYYHLFVIFVFALSACQKENENDPAATSDVSGFWIVQETVTGNCSGSTQTEYETVIYYINQTSDKLAITIYPNGDIVNGFIEGNKISWEGTLPDNSGNTDIDFAGSVLKDNTKVTGNANWEWYSDNYTCSGITEMTAQKVISETLDFSGQWQGTWTSEEYNLSGTFIANVTQDGTTLSGSIYVPEIDMTGATLKGFVSGNVVYFGDIDDKIKFVGLLEEDGASGNYSYNSLYDEGSWSATKGTGAEMKVLELINTFPIDIAFNGCSDMTFDGNYFYILSGKKIFVISKQGEVIDSLLTPGNYPDGLAFDGGHLLVGDNGWGTNKIYKFDTSSKNISALPAQGNTIGVTFGNNCFWYSDDEYDHPKVYKTDLSGKIMNSFDIDGRSVEGICFDGKNLWISYRNYEMFDHNKMAKLDTLGNVLDAFDPPSDATGALAFDGKFLWFADGQGFYKIDTLGNLFKSFDIPDLSLSETTMSDGLTFDGRYLWYTITDYDESGVEGHVVCMDTLGNIISSFNAPGDNSVDLAFDGTYLQLADRVTEKLYRLPVDGDYYLPFPEFDFQSMSANENYIFTYDSYDNKISKLNLQGDFLADFESPSNGPSGLYYDGNNLWYAENFLSDLTKVVKMDSEGNILTEYYPIGEIPDVLSIIEVDGEVWGITGNSISDFSLMKLKLAD